MVFIAAGLLVAVGLRSIASAMPWAAVGIGGVLMLAGLGMLAGWQLSGSRLNLNRFLTPDKPGSGLKGVFGYGVAYAVALYAQDQRGRNGIPLREDRTRHQLTTP